jgi:hypothetical protein
MSEQDNLEPQNDAEPETTADSRLEVAWEGVTDKPLLTQLARIDAVTAYAESLARDTKDLVAEGSPPEYGRIETTFSGVEKQVISYALHLVGFFSEELAPDAAALQKRLYMENERVLDVTTEEEREAVRAARERVEERRMKEVFAALGIEDDDVDQGAKVVGTWGGGEEYDDA